jgi:hypothetical protein
MLKRGMGLHNKGLLEEDQSSCTAILGAIVELRMKKPLIFDEELGSEIRDREEVVA